MAAEALADLEAAICGRFDAAAAACVPMARTGLYLGLLELIRPGQTVVMSPLTIVDVVNMVLLAGGVPAFTDILRRSCSIDPDQAESMIDERTGAVLVTHLHGETCGAHLFSDICRRKGVPLIEDAAQAFGAIENGRRLGTIGDLGVYSFGFYKNVNCWRGGMLVSPDKDLIARIRRRRDGLPALSRHRLLTLGLHGLATDAATWPPLFAGIIHPLLRLAIRHDVKAVHRLLDPEAGATRLTSMPADYLLNMATPQARIAESFLDELDAASDARIARAALYQEALDGQDGLITPKWQGDKSNVYTSYPVQFCERGALLRHAIRCRRDFAAQHLRNCADLPEFRDFYRDCPNARAASRELILLPTYPRYPEAEIRRNIEVIGSFLKQSGE